MKKIKNKIKQLKLTHQRRSLENNPPFKRDEIVSLHAEMMERLKEKIAEHGQKDIISKNKTETLPEDAAILSKVKHKIKKFKSKLAVYAAGAMESTNLGVIFLVGLTKALSGLGHFILYPAAMGASAIGAALSLRHAILAGKKDHLAALEAGVTVLVSILVITALILTFASQGVATVVGHGILTGAVGLKALYDLGVACYSWYKFFNHRKHHSAEAKAYKDQAIEYTIGFFVEAGFTAAIAAVFLLNKPTFGAIGIVAGAIGAGYATYLGYEQYKEKMKEEARLEALIEQLNHTLEHEKEEPSLTNNALLQAFLDYAKTDGKAMTYPANNEEIAPYSITIHPLQELLAKSPQPNVLVQQQEAPRLR